MNAFDAIGSGHQFREIVFEAVLVQCHGAAKKEVGHTDHHRPERDKLNRFNSVDLSNAQVSNAQVLLQIS